MSWWESFFDADYLHLWGHLVSPARTASEAEGLWAVLELGEGSRVLDAPCGYGRLSRALAERGAIVVGVDQSKALLEAAEKRRGDVPAEKLRYRHHDLRRPLDETGFDCAVNVYSSIGYGSDDDDVAIFCTLAGAVRPGGAVFVDTMHRDVAAAAFSRGFKNTARLPDGTIVVEEPRLDPITGRVETCWYWTGPSGSGQKPASLRLYTITELIKLLERAGLTFVSAHKGCSPEPFVAEGPDMGGRVGVLCRKEP
jgi:SAM-dependent methyltransferase